MAVTTDAGTSTAPRFKVRYDETIKAQLKDTLGLPNVMMVPTVSKIVVNMGVGTIITLGIANFKLREGNAIGCKVTLRGDRKWEFFDRLISIAIPRIRDFRGLNPNSFDGNGNYTFGVTEQLIFPEIDYDAVDTIRGMDITIVTTARTDAEGKALLDAFGFPFRKDR